MPKILKTSLLTLSVILSIMAAFKLYTVEEGLETYYESFKNSPVTITKSLTHDKGLVFIAHGFAGSTALMKPIATALAKSGYTTIRYDFRGHGHHPFPYSGDVTTITGATKLFLDDTDDLVKHYLNRSSHSKALIIGHSMASEIILEPQK